MATQYVTYAQGLHAKDADPEGYDPFEVGAEVNKGMFEPDDWDYHITHGNIVRKGGPNDPEVLAAANEPEEYNEADEDPAATPRSGVSVRRWSCTPAAVRRLHLRRNLSDLADAENAAQAEEDRKRSGPKVPEPKSADK